LHRVGQGDGGRRLPGLAHAADLDERSGLVLRGLDLRVGEGGGTGDDHTDQDGQSSAPERGEELLERQWMLSFIGRASKRGYDVANAPSGKGVPTRLGGTGPAAGAEPRERRQEVIAVPLGGEPGPRPRPSSRPAAATRGSR